MSLERVLKTLVSLGLTQLEAQIYVFLAKQGPKTQNELAIAFQLANEQIHSSLRNLQEKQIIKPIVQPNLTFSAKPFEEVLESLITTNMEQAQNIKNQENALSG